MHSDRFAGKSIIVTGGGSGIGRAVVARLAAEGGTVLAIDVNVVGLAESCDAANALAGHGGRAQFVCASVTDEARIGAIIREFAASQDALDAVINMAGILRAGHSAILSLAEFRAVLETNLIGTFLVCREALPFLEAGGGNIVNTASTAAFHGTPYSLAYAASKGGVAALTQTLAWEYTTRGVRVNAVAPGGIVTPMTAAHGGNMPEGADYSLLTHLMRPDMRMGQPEDVAGVIAMLASDDGRNITGEIIRIDGGVHA